MSLIGGIVDILLFAGAALALVHARRTRDAEAFSGLVAYSIGTFLLLVICVIAQMLQSEELLQDASVLYAALSACIMFRFFGSGRPVPVPGR